jgi:hypothetical protein
MTQIDERRVSDETGFRRSRTGINAMTPWDALVRIFNPSGHRVVASWPLTNRFAAMLVGQGPSGLGPRASGFG